MKYIAVLLFLFFSSCSKGPDLVEFPDKALADVFVSINGVQTSFESVLETHKGETIFIDIWAAWCRDCIKSMPQLKKLQEDFPKTTFLFLSLDKGVDGWKKGIKKYNLVGEHYFMSSGWKGPFAKAIDLDWIPRYMVIDTTGKISLYRAIAIDDYRIQEALKNN